MDAHFVTFALILLISSGISGSKDTPNISPQTCVSEGCLRGRYFTSYGGKRFEAYLGVPFAAPPVGEYRFKNPQAIQPWTGVYDASFERSKCVQKNDLLPNAAVEGSEDCLYLNLYKPVTAKNPGKPMAVMVFIHGGGYFAGSASMGEFGPDRLMDTGEVILVVIQYRLGAFGFLSTGDRVAPGNFGLKDQNAALRWVQRNIARFGGDPALVTLLGQSAGGASVQMHMMSPLSKGLFSRAVMMSGSALGFWHRPIEDPLKFAQEQAVAVGIASPTSMSTEELIRALREVDAIELGKSIDNLKFWFVYPLAAYHPVVENYVDSETFISEDPNVVWARGEYHQIPWRTGFVPNEGAFSSLQILLNASLVAELNEHAESYMPRLFGCKENEKSRRMLRQRFFPDGTDTQWITDANLNKIQDIFSEAFITYPIALTVKQYVDHVETNKNPIDLYYFSFKGNHSHSKYFSNTDLDFGVCHSDDLSYLFRSKDLFDDFEPDSPETAASAKLVDYYVRFAYDGVQDGTCQKKCAILEFANDASQQVKTDYMDGFDDEMIAFWTEIYS
ncbi:juvenile hormone esterase-like [Topomyia yanbarensis]|uniref:juvenile hormone esterase-like n=1 Tax=Topomyia yanbarensis TaxID=2498891 RepID=UPI00273B54BB|nr:juvenile hormone esterase-like [Topomyia yanbarensis]